MAKTITLELAHVGSHYVTIDGPNYRPGQTTPDREEVFVTFRTEWRGQPATVTMHADRYTASGYDEATNTSSPVLTEWRIWAQQARPINEDGSYDYGAQLSDTARHRLGEAAEPMVAEWLASDAYAQSEQDAYTDALRRVLREARPADYELRSLNQTFGRWAHKVNSPQLVALRKALDAFETYVKAMEALS